MSRNEKVTRVRLVWSDKETRIKQWTRFPLPLYRPVHPQSHAVSPSRPIFSLTPVVHWRQGKQGKVYGFKYARYKPAGPTYWLARNRSDICMPKSMRPQGSSSLADISST